MRRKEKWQQVKELAEQGYGMKETSRRVGMHHSSVLYIARQMGFKWKTNGRINNRPPRTQQETVGRVERMMRLACR